ncbi:hypothetical protein O6H91_02G041500 [Diphasiastrum complanatum]|uniref:Uncharacterized protein n=1 Tax=Diphasiastrum complanatum TaxID=34168 RepID=A0ACC2EEQ9_DIPCM|nr:hypothetical protein O6H91_02G041500 [Diphasiastrum complanatum]
MTNCKGVNTPMVPGIVLTNEDYPRDEAKAMEHKPYRRLIGSLMYLVDNTQPDIAYVVFRFSQFNINPGPTHWKIAKRIVQYLQNTKDYGLCYCQDAGFKIESYSDASWASLKDDSKSFLGGCTVARDAVVIWIS